jgi:hypothetical protein
MRPKRKERAWKARGNVALSLCKLNYKTKSFLRSPIVFPQLSQDSEIRFLLINLAQSPLRTPLPFVPRAHSFLPSVPYITLTMHFRHTIIIPFLAWHAACQLQLPMDLWQENASPEWVARPTWHKEQDNVGILEFNRVRDLAQNYFNWLVQQPTALTSSGRDADVLVAVFYDGDLRCL